MWFSPRGFPWLPCLKVQPQVPWGYLPCPPFVISLFILRILSTSAWFPFPLFFMAMKCKVSEGNGFFVVVGFIHSNILSCVFNKYDWINEWTFFISFSFIFQIHPNTNNYWLFWRKICQINPISISKAFSLLD